MSQPLLLIGAGGHAKACIDVLRTEKSYHIVGVVEADEVTLAPDFPCELAGRDSDLATLLAQTPLCLITVGQIQSATIRQSLFQRVKSLGGHLPIVASPLAYVAPTVQLGEGTLVMHQALVNTEAQIGVNGIINSQALVEHEVRVGDHCHLSTGCKVNGGVEIGNGCFIGSGAVIKQGVKLADNVIIGANSTVLADITLPGVYTGVIK